MLLSCRSPKVPLVGCPVVCPSVTRSETCVSLPRYEKVRLGPRELPSHGRQLRVAALCIIDNDTETFGAAV